MCAEEKKKKFVAFPANDTFCQLVENGMKEKKANVKTS